MELQQWLTQTQLGEFCFTILVSMLPVVELRGGIPFGVAAGLPMPTAFLAAFIGNMLPVPFLILFAVHAQSILFLKFSPNRYIPFMHQHGCKTKEGGSIMKTRQIIAAI